jgi:hypothetical protein
VRRGLRTMRAARKRTLLWPRLRPERLPATIATVSRSIIPSKRKFGRAKALPWVGLLQAGVALGKRWKSLSEKDRARLTGLLRESGGRLGNLSSKERKELRKLAGKLDLKGMGRELLPLLPGRRRKRR